jgi:DNA-binding LacI/PurR family transcriptional regulator
VVDGVILVSARENDEILDVVRNLELVAAFVGHPRDDLPYVGIDNLHAAEQITTRLRSTGRRRIGMIAAAMDRDSGIDRFEGFKRALGAEFDPELVVSVDHYSYANGVSGMRTLLSQHPDLDGVFAASDAVAAGALEVLHEAGIDVPGQIGIVGFDDSAWALRCQPALSTVRQPAVTLGERAAQLVLAQLRNEEVDMNVVLDTPIVWRDSA